MVTLIPLAHENSSFLEGTSYAAMDPQSIEAMVDESIAGEHEGAFFRLFAVIEGDVPVGIINMYSPSGSVINVGPEIREEHRRNGYAFQAYRKALQLAAEMGYTDAFAVVRSENKASIALHRKLGFAEAAQLLSRSGKPVIVFVLNLLSGTLF